MDIHLKSRRDLEEAVQDLLMPYDGGPSFLSQ